MKSLIFALPLLAAGLATLCCTQASAQFLPGQTILNIDYENGQPNSGITGVNPTNATAADAAYMVQPGATGNHAVAHKIVRDDANTNNGYYSDGNWRSESDAQQIPAARYYPGDERRYEFSVLLKDWPVWTQEDPINESNLFQLKVSGGENVPLMIRVQRNVLRIRYEDVSTFDLVNYTNYVNQWIHFRIDVKWSKDATGYMRTYIKLPGETGYTLKHAKENSITYTGDVVNGEHGYIKWGLYVAPPDQTRIAYHDDIRIINLNQAALWANELEGTAPPTRLSSQNPYTTNDVKDANITVSGIGFSQGTLGATGSNLDRYLVNMWNTTGSVDLSEYFNFTLNPGSTHPIDFSQFLFGYTRGSSSPHTYQLRANIKPDGTPDDYNTIIGSGTVPTTATSGLEIIDLSAYQNISAPISFRLYWYGPTTAGVGISKFRFDGAVDGGSLPVIFNTISANYTGGIMNVNWTTASEQNNSFFEIQISKDGKNFTTVETVVSKNGNSAIPQDYKAVINAFKVQHSLPLFILITIAALTHIKKRRRLGWILPIFFITMISASCTKSNSLPASSEQSFFIRIKQVDVDGHSSYSKVIKV